MQVCMGITSRCTTEQHVNREKAALKSLASAPKLTQGTHACNCASMPVARPKIPNVSGRKRSRTSRRQEEEMARLPQRAGRERNGVASVSPNLSLIHISEPTRLALI
eukprot:10492888-Alexandrium_andersonii.AAC.1